MFDIMDKYETLHPKIGEKTFFSSPQQAINWAVRLVLTNFKESLMFRPNFLTIMQLTLKLVTKFWKKF